MSFLVFDPALAIILERFRISLKYGRGRGNEGRRGKKKGRKRGRWGNEVKKRGKEGKQERKEERESGERV